MTLDSPTTVIVVPCRRPESRQRQIPLTTVRWMLAQQEQWCKIGITCDFRADVDELQKQQKLESLAETFDLQRPELLHASNNCVHPDVTFKKNTRVSCRQSNHESGLTVPLRGQAQETTGSGYMITISRIAWNIYKHQEEAMRQNDIQAAATKPRVTRAMSGDEGGAAGAPQRLSTDCFLSNDGQVAGLRPTSSAPHSSERGGRAADSGPSRHRSILRRDKESIDCDMPDTSNTELLIPLRHIVTTGDGSPLLTDAMLVDHNDRNPRMSFLSGDCPVSIDQPPRNKQVQKRKSRKNGVKTDKAETNVVTSRARGGNYADLILQTLPSNPLAS